MSAKFRKSVAAAVGAGAIVTAAVVVGATCTDDSGSRSLAGGSGDSATGTSYVSPTVPTMALTANVTTAATMTAAPPVTTLAQIVASPTYKASPEPGCINNGQCP
jgi:hypothetical protein